MNKSILSPFIFLFPDLSRRWSGRELMDDPGCTISELYTTLGSFKYVNALLSRYKGALNRYLIPHMLKQHNRSVTIVDLGAGGCDIPIWLAARCQKLHIPMKIICIDNDPRAVAYAKGVCNSHAAIDIRCIDFFDLDPVSINADYIISNHFLHHIEASRIPDFFCHVKACARIGFLMNDIRRASGAYSLFTLFAGVFFRRGFAFHDGRISIRRSFTKLEIRQLLLQAGLADDVSVKSLFPYRLLVMSFGS